MNIFEDIRESIENYLKEQKTIYKASQNWFEYILGFTKNHCFTCFKRKNKIYSKDEKLPELSQHEMCKCKIYKMRMVDVGKATTLGKNGADYWLKSYGRLPDYYITKYEAEKLGWVAWKGNLDKVAPGKMIGPSTFSNREGKLPSKEGRIWYECDIDYQSSYRNNARLVFSNDGLIFKTDCHYDRFIAVE